MEEEEETYYIEVNILILIKIKQKKREKERDEQQLKSLLNFIIFFVRFFFHVKTKLLYIIIIYTIVSYSNTLLSKLLLPSV